MEFSGAKLALFIGKKLLVIRRDDKPEIPYPGHWDLPGGGREGRESPQECVLRETREEIGLVLGETDLAWSRRYLRAHRGWVWFFVAHQAPECSQRIVFGCEGQGWDLMDPRDYCNHPLAVPHFAEQLRLYLDNNGTGTVGV